MIDRVPRLIDWSVYNIEASLEGAHGTINKVSGFGLRCELRWPNVMMCSFQSTRYKIDRSWPVYIYLNRVHGAI